MKIVQTNQIREIDRYTVEHEPISSYGLMNRAARAFFEELIKHIEPDDKVVVVAGSGNNGGDALVIARLLLMVGQKCEIFQVNLHDRLSDDCKNAFDELSKVSDIIQLRDASGLNLHGTEVVVDGIFGSGLNRPLECAYQRIVDKINNSGCRIFSIDIPSGLFGEDDSGSHQGHVVCADYTFTFQLPKPCFFMAHNERFVGNWKVLDIHLHEDAIKNLQTPYYLTSENDIRKIVRKRSKFAHKGTCGHALLITGSYGMMGAAILSTQAALRTGCGMVTARIPKCGYGIMQTSVPEAIVSIDDNESYVSAFPDLKPYDALAVGPGIGKSGECKKMLESFIENQTKPFVLDADALNLFSEMERGWEHLPANTILTPHPKEFERITHTRTKGYASWLLQLEFSKRHQVIIVLKGAYTSISLPDGTLHVNSTGNPGMATAGSGDTLTGIIVSLLAQGYTPQEAAILGVWMHGKSGDFAAQEEAEESLLARDLSDHLAYVWRFLHRETKYL